MSYILDALKRADAERGRGAAPGLHTHHQVPSGSPGTANANRPLWLAVAAGVTLLLLAAGFWFWRAAGDPAPVAEQTATPPVATAPVQVAQAPKTPVRPVATAAPTAAKAVVSAPAPAAPASPVAAASATAPAAAPLLAELPQGIRSQIPKITITGSVYSASPAQRLLLANNLVLAQGDQVAPDLTLEEIQPRSSVLIFKGTRFRVMH
jgi:general secretion pathway protein B